MKYSLGLIFLVILGPSAHARKARTVELTDKKMERVIVGPGRSVILNFPSRPTKVIVGNQGLFAVEYVENDLAIAALRNPAHSNLFVYLEGRRFGFDLQTGGDADEVLIVRDSGDHKIKVRIKE